MSNPYKTKSRALMKKDANGIVIPKTQNEMTFRGAYTGTNLIYAGWARPGSDEGTNVWQICMMSYDVSNNLLDIKWPINTDGAVSSNPEFNWTGRAGYTYA